MFLFSSQLLMRGWNALRRQRNCSELRSFRLPCQRLAVSQPDDRGSGVLMLPIPGQAVQDCHSWRNQATHIARTTATRKD